MPSPVPVSVVPANSLANSSRRSAGDMPEPSSLTVTSTPSSEGRTVTAIRTPSPACRAALVIRLISAWRNRSRSPGSRGIAPRAESVIRFG